jgi:hypothetical protein
MAAETGTGGNFDDKLTLHKNPDGGPTVDARGPKYGTLKTISVWVTQPQGPNDAAAAGTAGPTVGKLIDIDPDPKDKEPRPKWSLLAAPATETPLKEGAAFAMAIAKFLNEEREEKVRLWAQPVQLVWAPEAAPAPEGQTSGPDDD